MRLKTLAATAAALMCAAPATASTATNGYVTGFAPINNGVMIVFTDGTRSTDVPTCSNHNYPNRWAFDMTTPTGQGFLSVLLTARALHEPVTFYGTGACSNLGDSESLSAVVTNNLL